MVFGKGIISVMTIGSDWEMHYLIMKYAVDHISYIALQTLFNLKPKTTPKKGYNLALQTPFNIKPKMTSTK